ncbi:hypothetical protein ACFOLA_04845 [Salinicoccus hispanicus]|uniref:DUF998 domain-containing protein n=1 Tax=Salinicoccus hispanicus TaxID=157225 RepID=A0A6N8U2Z6_9STAP|nr:hypothetical protein [Salinicoccus hispanicus]MXQ52142.1 hypothetical protein [Salinicoccus hispanicus]
MINLTQVKKADFINLPFIISGIAFVLYPIIRPFSDEKTMEGAVVFASGEWMISHILGMVAFTFLSVGFLGLSGAFENKSSASSVYTATGLSIIGLGLTMPYYGGETFGLHAIGHAALDQQNDSLVSLEAIVRSGPGLILFIIGLILLVISTIIVANTFWKSGKHSKWTGVLLAIGMILYLPQFLADQPLRVIHGLLMAVGCFSIAWEITRSRK